MREKLQDSTASNKTLANIQSVMRKALDDAINDELIDINPLANWCFSKIEAPKEEDEIDPFSKEEQAIILKQLTGQARNFIQFAFWTGMRTSELVALEWGDIDFSRNVAKVTRALTQKSKEAESTKTAAGRREVKLLQPVLEALKEQKQHTWLKGAEVFQTPQTEERWTGDQRSAKPCGPGRSNAGASGIANPIKRGILTQA